MGEQRGRGRERGIKKEDWGGGRRRGGGGVKADGRGSEREEKALVLRGGLNEGGI